MSADPTPIPPAASESPVAGPTRRTSIDAYRGLVMFLMMAEVLHLADVADNRPQNRVLAALAQHQEHVEWVGCVVHDLIQPSFSFLVGTALAFSIASRKRRGQPIGRMFGHALWRSLVLVLLGIFLRSIRHDRTYYTFDDTLTQIGLGYPFLFLIALRPRRDQIIAVVVILVGYWAAFALYPLPGPDFDYGAVGVASDWRADHGLTDFAAHWDKNSNAAWAFDRQFLNLFPRESPFLFHPGGYSTLSFIPTLGTMVLGLLAGGFLRADRSRWATQGVLIATGLALLAAGWGLGYWGICPVVKRIWTPSWTLYSGGWCFLILAGFDLTTDLIGFRAWAFPLLVIGANSIAAYLMSWLFEDFIAEALTRHLPASTFNVLGAAYEPIVLGAGVLLTDWLILFWLYRRRIFLKV